MPTMRVNTEQSSTDASQSLRNPPLLTNINPAPISSGRIFFMRNLTITLLLLATLQGWAQSTFGVRGGVNLSYTRVIIDYSKYEVIGPGDPAIPPSSKEKENFSPLLRTSFGIFLEQNFTNKIGLREELLYQGLGNNGKVGKSRLDYAIIPISFFWRIHPKFTVSTGNYIGILVHTPGGFVEPKYYSDSFDYGFQSAVEYSLTPKIAAGLSYYYGVLNVAGGPMDERLRAGQVYLAYTFKPKRSAD